MKKILAVTLSTLMILATATGCLKRVDPNSTSDAVIGGNSGDEIDNIINPDKNMEGKLKIAVPNVDSHIDAIEAFVSSYNEKFPNIDVEIVKFDLDQYKGKVKDFAAAAQAVNRPQDMFDVFWLPQDYINEWYSLRLVGSLDALIEKDPDVSKDMLISNAVESSSVNGSLYMMPRDYNQVVMYYNKKMFDDVGMDYPTSKMSAADFEEMIVELRERLCTSNKTNDYGVKYKEGISCIIDCNIKWDSLAWPLLKSFGGTIVNEQGEVTFDSEENLNAFKYWKSLTENEDYACPLAISVEKGGTNPGIQFRMQQAPLYFQSRAVASDIVTSTTMGGQTYYGITDLGAAGLPQFGPTYTIGGGCSGYAVYSEVVNVTEAWQFVKHVVSVEGQNAYSETGGCVPVRKDLLEDKNAAWRKSLPDVFDAADHEAFVENMDCYASTRDFYQYIPLSAQSSILAKIEETFNSMAPLKNDSIMRGTLTSYAQTMQDIINKAKK